MPWARGLPNVRKAMRQRIFRRNASSELETIRAGPRMPTALQLLDFFFLSALRFSQITFRHLLQSAKIRCWNL